MSTDVSVKAILDNAGITIQDEETFDYIIHCINPNHRDSTPSLRVDKDTGIYHCFACGYKGNFTRLISELEIEVTPEILEEIHYDELRRKVQKVNAYEDSYINYKVKKVPGIPIAREYRGISPSTFKAVGAIRNIHLGRLVIPIMVHNMLQGYTMRSLVGQKPKYLHTSDIKFSSLLFPFDLVKSNGKPNILYITEGPFDALNLIEHGKQAVCIFGADSWSDFKLSLLLELAPKHVVLLFDNDKAGYNGMYTLAKNIHRFVDTYVPINYNALSFTDPGEATTGQLEGIQVRKFV